MKVILKPESSFIQSISFERGLLEAIGIKKKDKVRVTITMAAKKGSTKSYDYEVTQDILQLLKDAVDKGESVGDIYRTYIKGTGHPE